MRRTVPQTVENDGKRREIEMFQSSLMRYHNDALRER